MEQDIKERNARVQEKIRVSNSLKEQGNEAFRIGDYFKAVELYTNSIDTYWSNKESWLNRACCYLKQKQFEKAVQDCTEIIQYMEIIEDGFERSRELAIKAFLWRSKARFHLMEFRESFEDSLMAKKILGKDDQEIDQNLEKTKKAWELQQSSGASLKEKFPFVSWKQLSYDIKEDEKTLIKLISNHYNRDLFFEHLSIDKIEGKLSEN